MRLALPESLREFVESSGSARALVLALLLSRDSAIRDRQLTLLRKSTSAAELEVVRSTLPIAESLAPMLRLPALLQIFPALRRLPQRERAIACEARGQPHPRRRAHRRLRILSGALARHTACETSSRHVLRMASFRSRKARRIFRWCSQRSQTFGAADARQARMAYEAGMQSVMPMHRPPYLAIENWPQRLARFPAPSREASAVREEGRDRRPGEDHRTR